MSAPKITTKTETIKTTYKVGGEYSPSYKSNIMPRTTVIQRTMATVPSISMKTSRSFSSMPSGSYQAVSSAGVTNVIESRDKEKKDMQDLNGRFASYIEKVRFLEAQNRKLAEELNYLKERWGKETAAIKAMYQAELDECRKQLDEAEKEKSRLEIKSASLEEVIAELRSENDELQAQHAKDRETIDHQNQQLSDYEAEINLLRRRIEQLEGDHEHDKKEIARLQEALNRARMDLDVETLNHIDAENRRQTLEEEIEFLKEVHEQEMKELAALAYRDTTSENREFWKNELASAIRDIQAMYDEKLDALRAELESNYNMKIQEMRNGAARNGMDNQRLKDENKKIRNELNNLRAKLAEKDALIAQLRAELESQKNEYDRMIQEMTEENDMLREELDKLRAELEAILKELQDLMDTKLGLELEIAAYRKLLEGEETRAGLTDVVNRWAGQQGDQQLDPNRPSLILRGEMSAKTTYQRSAKGPVSLHECSPDGKYITLENTSRKAEDLSNWKILRTIDRGEPIEYPLPADFSLKPNSKSKIWTQSAQPYSAGPNDIEIAVQGFGVGSDIVTKLINSASEERASHVQKTLYTQ